MEERPNGERDKARRRARSLDAFARNLQHIRLRPYQLEAAQAVVDSIAARAGRSIVIMFSRQSGKDELSANLKAYLLARRNKQEVGIVEVNPTYKPQTINAIQRLEERLKGNPLTQKTWRKRSDFMRMIGRAKVTFLSGDSKANVVGAVASLLLIVNEAQDIEPAVYDRNFAPMAASTNATRLFMGTAWTSHTLLSRELRAARQAEQADGIRRVFTYDADDVRRVLPEYGAHVDGEIARLGRGHPLIRTQYFNEEIDAQASMFTPARRAMMRCTPTLPPPNAGSVSSLAPGALPAFGGGGRTPEGVVFAIDVAGQDEATFHNPDLAGARPYGSAQGRDLGPLRNPGRDAVTLTIATVDLSAMDTLQAPIFRIVQREQWTGLNHLTIFGKLSALADQWQPQHIVIDATGVGEGLWAMLDRRYPTRVMPVKFSAQKKSEIGYRFLAMIETGRLSDCSGERASGPHRPLRSPEGPEPADGRGVPAPRGAGIGDGIATSASGLPLLRRGTGLAMTRAVRVTSEMVDRQYTACVSEVLLGPQKTMRWGVPEGTRDEDGNLIHDDIVMADALLAEADLLEWRVHTPAVVIAPKDPLEDMSHF